LFLRGIYKPWVGYPYPTDQASFQDPGGGVRLGPTQGGVGGTPPPGGGEGSRGTQKMGVKKIYTHKKGPKIFFLAFGRTQSGWGVPPPGGSDLRKKPATDHTDPPDLLADDQAPLPHPVVSTCEEPPLAL